MKKGAAQALPLIVAFWLQANVLCAAQQARKGASVAPQREELHCQSEEATTDPMQVVAAWAKMDEAQRKRLDELLAGVSSAGTRSRAASLKAALLANAGDSTRNEESLVDNVAGGLADVLAGVRLDTNASRRLARDLWVIVNVERTGSMASSAVGNIHNQLKNSGARGARLAALADSLNAILRNQFDKDWARKAQ